MPEDINIELDVTEIVIDSGGVELDLDESVTELQLGQTPVELTLTEAPVELTLGVATASGGIGLPPGGTTGQVLTKLSDLDGDAGWADPTGGGGPALPAPDLVDETSTTFFYFGWGDVGGDWLIRRQVRANSDILSADSTNNPLFSDLATAWPNRVSLTYGP